MVDLKDLKVYEGVADNADATLVGDEESIVQLIKKDISFADAIAQVRNFEFNNSNIVLIYLFINFQGKVQVLGNVELMTKAFENRG